MSDVADANPCCRHNPPLVLAVDDEPCISRVVEIKLRRHEFDVLRAASGEEGLEKFIEHRPDVLITDVNMPGMSGIELCARCEEFREDSPFLTIVLTSQLDPDTQAWLARSPHRKYLSKPFSLREVLRLVEEYTTGGQAGRRPLVSLNQGAGR